MFDHVGHQLRRIAANAEEFKATFIFYKALKDGMSRYAHPMPILALENLAQSYEWLDIPTRTYCLNDDVQGWRSFFIVTMESSAGDI